MAEEKSLKVVQLQTSNTFAKEDIVKLLEGSLERAKKGEFKSIAICAMLQGDGVFTTYQQNNNAVELIGGLEIIKKRLLELFQFYQEP